MLLVFGCQSTVTAVLSQFLCVYTCIYVCVCVCFVMSCLWNKSENSGKKKLLTKLLKVKVEIRGTYSQKKIKHKYVDIDLKMRCNFFNMHP